MTVDLGAYGDPEAPAPQAIRRVRRPGRYAVLAVPLLLVLADLLVLGAHAHAADRGDPRRTARALFAAIAAHDLGGVLALAPGVDVDDQQLRTQGAPTDVTIGATTTSGDTATVEVRWVVARSPHSSLLRLRSGDPGLLATRRWQVVGGLPVLTVTAPAYEKVAYVAGRAVPLAAGGARLTLLPGLVGVSVPAALPTAAQSVTIVAAGDRVDVGFDGEVDGSSTATLETAVDVRILQQYAAVLPQGAEHNELALTVDADNVHVTVGGDLVDVLPDGHRVVVAVAGHATYVPGDVRLDSLVISPPR